MDYTLKDKLAVTKDFINELTEKSWQEIEHIQNQIANLADSTESNRVKNLLNNLLTSYYVFVGCLENFDISSKQELPAEITPEPVQIEITNEPIDEPELEYAYAKTNGTSSEELDISEPFEYFVDFDEPIGDPITDKDLYND